MAADDKAAPAKKGPKFLVFGLLGIVAAAGGAAMPLLLPNPLFGTKSEKVESKPALIPMEAVVVNLAEVRLSRYLKVKVVLVVDSRDKEKVETLLREKQPYLKSWLLSHLADLSLKQVTGKIGQNRLRREIRDQFNAMLFPDGSEKISDVLFEEFVVQ
ncbi:MAG: hypothetical protein KatS3mg105_0213 [Gemmatales bacterium]|nr:MAG: hypothetical protein KatS3mg105_0213 [Gemmatales bacterium]